MNEVEVSKSSRRGAPARNRNAAKHLIFSTGPLPAGLENIARALAKERRIIETMVLELHGVLTPVSEMAIQTAMKWARHGALCAKWLKDGYSELTVDQRVNISREIARASGERDRVLKGLLDKPMDDDFFDGSVDLPTDDPAPLARSSEASSDPPPTPPDTPDTATAEPS